MGLTRKQANLEARVQAERNRKPFYVFKDHSDNYVVTDNEKKFPWKPSYAAIPGKGNTRDFGKKWFGE